MGRNAAEMLMGQIAGTGSGPRTLVLSTELVVRGSTAPPPAQAVPDQQRIN
jgi:DNA-binding LacI/PurR family transcriptional regulator